MLDAVLQSCNSDMWKRSYKYCVRNDHFVTLYTFTQKKKPTFYHHLSRHLIKAKLLVSLFLYLFH